MRMAQVTNPNVLQLLIPGTVVTSSGTIERLEQGSNVGKSLLADFAHEVVLSGSADATTRQQWIFHKAYVEEGTEFEYTNTDQTIGEIPFRVVPDPAKEGATDALWRHETFPE